MKISVHGLGHVGLVAAAALAAQGHQVLGLDIDRAVVGTLNKGHVVYFEPGLKEMVVEGLASGRLRFAHLDDVKESPSEMAMVCVGTPSLNNGGANLSYVRSAIRWIIAHEPRVDTVVMKSTVPPGTGRSLATTMLQGTDIDYVSNSEFLREGHAVQDWFHPDRIVAGATSPEALKRIKKLYQGIEAPYVETDVTSAEMIKYASNAFLATKIAFVNEIANLCERMGATIDDVSLGIGMDPRIGPAMLRAGLGYGGSCFPKDVRALDFQSTANGHSFELLRSVITVNNRQRLLPLLSLKETFGSLQGVPVAVLGLSFKPDTDDTRDAPALDLIPLLVEEGAEVRAYDPAAKAQGILPPETKVCHDAYEALKGSRALVLCTEWDEFVRLDWAEIAKAMEPPRLVFDGRNALDPGLLTSLGFDYRGVGRSPKAVRSPLRSA
ncbi:MAG: UDP-glucose/GDP-mannose dehydrogenase family protein [Dehalococcoidia bacterium]|nr:UDP-glucose/GDP-mannose dehydrogenase family protein [Dehalococcoidia bacterium]